jgi:lysophospholipase L1-like esterase
MIIWEKLLLVSVNSLEIVIMGDSFAAGAGARSSCGWLDYSLNYPIDCFRSNSSYAVLFAKGVNATKITHVACGGSRMSHLTKPRQMNSVPKFPWQDCPQTSDEEYTVPYTWHCERYVKPQFEAITNTTDLVIISTGGNDSGAYRVIQNCFCPFDADEEKCEQIMNKSKTRISEGIIETSLIKQLAKIEPKLHPNAKIALIYYPLLVLDVGYELGDIQPNPDQQVREFTGKLNEVIYNASIAGNNSRFVVVYPFTPEDFAGHEVDPRRGPFHVNPDRWLYEPIFDLRGVEYFHPNQQGHEGLAEAMIRRKDIFGL